MYKVLYGIGNCNLKMHKVDGICECNLMMHIVVDVQLSISSVATLSMESP